MQLNPKALGWASAILCGAFWFLAMTFSLLSGVGIRTMTTLGAFHPFFTYSWWGMVVIVVENLIGGYIGGWLFAWLYNKLLVQHNG
ncbi:MAG: hypothetical protein HY982_02175 [Candidatus Magasanikbacteria bacterium]|nr:hypothetical protein [Candidatus Magasanikbacteria bacterium]